VSRLHSLNRPRVGQNPKKGFRAPPCYFGALLVRVVIEAGLADLRAEIEDLPSMLGFLASSFVSSTVIPHTGSLHHAYVGGAGYVLLFQMLFFVLRTFTTSPPSKPWPPTLSVGCTSTRKQRAEGRGPSVTYYFCSENCMREFLAPEKSSEAQD